MFLQGVSANWNEYVVQDCSGLNYFEVSKRALSTADGRLAERDSAGQRERKLHGCHSLSLNPDRLIVRSPCLP